MMSQQLRFIQLPLVGMTLLCLLGGVYFAARKRVSKHAPAGKVIKHSVDTSPDDALTYWTADRMRNARAADMPHIDKLDQGKKRPPHTPDARKS